MTKIYTHDEAERILKGMGCTTVEIPEKELTDKELGRLVKLVQTASQVATEEDCLEHGFCYSKAEVEVPKHEWQTQKDSRLADGICTLANARLKGHISDYDMIDEVKEIIEKAEK